MNNDIPSDFKYFGAKKQSGNPSKRTAEKSNVNAAETHESDFKDSMTFMGNMGCAQVNMSKPNLSSNTAKSVDEFLKDPEYADLYISFGDSLVEKGYKLEDATRITDTVFDALSDKDTYN